MTNVIMWFSQALRLLTDPDSNDRGEVIPTAIIYAVAAVIAVALLTAASDYVFNWIGLWPTAAAPGPPAP